MGIWTATLIILSSSRVSALSLCSKADQCGCHFGVKRRGSSQHQETIRDKDEKQGQVCSVENLV